MVRTYPVNQIHYSIRGSDYRHEIDGLRALAVLSVITFHFFPSWMPGGYVGVDVFFVISGYLITTIICTQLMENRFSLLKFYYKRINRLFPSLILVLAATIMIGFFILADEEYELLGKHILAGATFSSNFVYWSEFGYFDNAVETKPLLHLWSLAVEEQFYIIFPLLLLVNNKVTSKALPLTLILFFLSLIFCIATTRVNLVEAFYSPLARCWELFLGSLIAHLRIDTSKLLSSLRDDYSNVMSLSGLLLIAYSAYMFTKETVFPGWTALVPASGTLLILCSSSCSFVNQKILSQKILVSVGRYSYPLYLWHWPLLFFINTTGFQFFDGLNGSRFTRAACILFAILLSFATYRCLEYPVRFKAKGNLATWILCALMILMGSIGISMYISNGTQVLGMSRHEHYGPEVRKIMAAYKFRDYPKPDAEYYDYEYGRKFKALGTSPAHKIVIIGDSHAHQYWNAFAHLTRRYANESYKIMLNDAAFVPEINDNLINDPAVKTVVFSYFWALQYGSKKVNQTIRCCGTGNGGIVGSSKVPIYSSMEQDEMDRKFIALVNKLKGKGKNVYFILDNPFGEEFDAHSMVERSIFSIKYKPSPIVTQEEFIERSQPVRDRIIEIASITHSFIIDPVAFLCENEICSPFDKHNELLYKDYDHLSYYAVINSTKFLTPVLQTIAEPME